MPRKLYRFDGMTFVLEASRNTSKLGSSALSTVCLSGAIELMNFSLQSRYASIVLW